jgi:hypothetical protein
MRNTGPKNRIRINARRPFILFKCQFPFCCNFITQSFGAGSVRYCKSHGNPYATMKLIDSQQIMDRFVITKSTSITWLKRHRG